MPEGWRWDETLYLGSAPYYLRGRLPYAPGVADSVARALALDGRGRLIDIGCGPGIVALLLAPRFAEVVGVDADQAMLTEADRRATETGVGNARWVRARGEALPFGDASCRVATFAQSFHWLERDRAAAGVFDLLQPGGAVVHISDVKEECQDPGDASPHPRPPLAAIADLVRAYLGPVRRAGQGVLRHGTPGDEAAVFHRAGFVGPQRRLVPATGLLVRGADDIVAWVASLSSSAPHLFGERRDRFEHDLRRLLRDASPTGRFAQPLPDTEIFVWRRPGPGW